MKERWSVFGRRVELTPDSANASFFPSVQICLTSSGFRFKQNVRRDQLDRARGSK